MILPSAFVQNVINSFGDSGRHFLDELPNQIFKAAQRWDLTIGDPFLLSYNYVCSVTKADGIPAVLKIGVPNRELISEISALKVYAGKGACLLLESAGNDGMLLLERLQPGIMLSTLKDDDRATEIAAQVMQAIHRPVPEGNEFISLHNWFDELKKLRPTFGGGTGPFPEKTVEIVLEMVRDLFGENRPHVLLHGDFHHFNILSSDRGWLVIDPKGVDGPAEYEVGPFLLNPWGNIPDEKEAIRRTLRRIAILSEQLGFDRQRLLNWAICYSLLSAWWDTAKDGSGGEYSRAWTEILIKIKR
ncbi:MAG: aminoglycoside phosphotransferase family protein [Anaerolineales bacterium]|jgi:streptomycin 6-kinase